MFEYHGGKKDGRFQQKDVKKYGIFQRKRSMVSEFPIRYDEKCPDMLKCRNPRGDRVFMTSAMSTESALRDTSSLASSRRYAWSIRAAHSYTDMVSVTTLLLGSSTL
ncbi:hypothetical protein PoB_002879200 [Plakobranchus ocellatus]|uniref:Uncharacterized protein n=1 Tax=Plakobranchus ocellatus TaxID=259542 RepID=A0AAV4A4T6_9GAST|nr:hypothetical protein PoB_002879200 [Plakobranchus ocellatus]